MRKYDEAFVYTVAALFIFGGSLNLLGLFLLIRLKPKPDHQTRILKNLSVLEILYSFWYVVNAFYQSDSQVWILIYDFSWASIYAVYQLLILHLITDKVASVYLHLRYPVFVTPNLSKRLLASFWFFGVFLGLTIVFLEKIVLNRNLVQRCWEYSILSFDIFILINLVLQFSYLFNKSKEIRKNNHRVILTGTNTLVYFPRDPLLGLVGRPIDIRSENKESLGKQTTNTSSLRATPKFMIPIVIVCSYAVCTLTSTIIFAAINKKDEPSDAERTLLHSSYILEAATIIVDAITYMLLQKQIRKHLKNMVELRFQRI